MTVLHTSTPKTTLCGNSELSERVAFKHLGFRSVHRIASEIVLSNIYPKQKVPDGLFDTGDGSVAVEVKRITNVMHVETLLNALQKVHARLVEDFDVKVFHIVLQTRESGQRDKVSCIVKDAHGIMKKLVPCIPYVHSTGPKLFVHVQKVEDCLFDCIGS